MLANILVVAIGFALGSLLAEILVAALIVGLLKSKVLGPNA